MSVKDYSKYSIDIFENSLSSEVCEDIIKRFEADDRKFAGGVSYGDGSTKVNDTFKKCTELYVSAHKEWKDVDDLLFAEIRDKILFLREKYPGLKRVHKVKDEGYRVKRYLNDGTEFFHWHIDSNGKAQSHRYCVFQWYLNTVEEGGETEFRIEGDDGKNILVKPTQGTMISFPPFWTHEHRGLAPVSGPKYIVCSWITM